MKSTSLHPILAVAVLALSVLPIGLAVFLLGFVFGDSPCVMCWAQRTGMALVALTGLFILRFGPRPRYIGFGILLGAWGLFMAARHAALHLGRDVGQGFSIELLGAHTYTWSAVIFWVSVVTMGALLLLMRDGEATGGVRDLGPLGKAAAAVFLAVIAGNVVQAFASTGPPPFMGQSDPIRFSFHPRNWVWSLEEWHPQPVSLRGRWDIEKPSLTGLETDWRKGPLASPPRLSVKRELAIAGAVRGEVTDLAYDAASDRFLLTTDAQGVVLLDGGLETVQRHTVIDPGFSVDVTGLVGAAFVDRATVAALARNKSIVVLKETDGADARKNFRFFLESFDRFEEVTRTRFSTVRARLMYTLSLGFDPASDSFYTVTVPNRRQQRLVVSRFDRKDMTLSEEFSPGLAGAAGLSLAGEKRSLREYYVSGVTIEDGRMYAISAAFSTLLLIDLRAREVAAAYAIEGLDRPAGIAVKGTELFIAVAGKRVLVVDKPAVPAPVSSGAGSAR